MKTLLSHLGEFGLIDRISRRAPLARKVKLGIGDDAAVLAYSARKYLLLTTDMLVEDVHFTRRDQPQQVGHKSLACNISDIAAMGGLPTYAVISWGLPSRLPVTYVDQLMRGIERLAKDYQISIVGGDTVKSDKIIINIALLGEVKNKHLVTRSGAQKGDLLMVTGPLGGSLPSGRHLTFQPRIKAVQFLVHHHYQPTAMIDISDGLVGDLFHILKASRVGAVIYEDRIPRNTHKGQAVALEHALYDGEDYELLFTLRQAKAERLLKHRHPDLPFFAIGEITGHREQVVLVDRKGHKTRIERQGYTHF
jgi:thiamine-monophosphate kinase